MLRLALLALAVTTSPAHGAILKVRVSSQTACSTNCIQLASPGGPFGAAVCSRDYTLGRRANCHVTTSMEGQWTLPDAPSGECAVLRLRMYTVGQALLMPEDLDHPREDAVTFTTDDMTGSPAELHILSTDAYPHRHLSLWLNDNFPQDDDFEDALVELEAVGGCFTVQGVDD